MLIFINSQEIWINFMSLLQDIRSLASRIFVLFLAGSGPPIPYGLPCVRELLRFLISLINPYDRYVFQYSVIR